MVLMMDIVGLASGSFADVHRGYYPLSNSSSTAISSTGQASSLSASSKSSTSSTSPGSAPLSSTTYALPSSTYRSTLGSGSLLSSSAPSSGVVPPYPYSTGASAYSGSRGSFFPGGYGSLPTAYGQPSNGGPSYPYPTGTGYPSGSGGSRPFGTGGYYPAGNGTRSTRHSTIYLTEFITQDVAPCTINAIDANVYYWDTYYIGFTACPTSTGTGDHPCLFTPSTPSYSLGAPATRLITTWAPATPTYIPDSTSYFTYGQSGATNPLVTETNFVYGGVTYSKVTYEVLETVAGSCE